MTSTSLKNVNYRNPQTPQSEKAAKGQVKNNAGGYTFKVTPFDLAKRFLILGSEKNFYQTGQKLSKLNADNLIKVIKNGQSRELVDEIVAVSKAGRAPKQQPGLFALAIASSYGTDEEKRYALSRLAEVARTGNTLFEFISFALQFRPWGRALKRAVAEWYTTKTPEQVAYQILKYRQREGWTHADVLAVANPKGDEAWHGLGQYIRKGDMDRGVPEIVRGFEKVKNAPQKDVPAIVTEFGLSWEMIPSEKLDAKTWETILQTGNLPLGALLRQLPTLTKNDILKPLSDNTKRVITSLTDPAYLKKARIHPLSILLAQKTYASGRSLRGESSWTPNAAIINALEKAFYASFEFVEPTNKNFLLGLDVSGSMSSSAGGLPLSSFELEAALALVIQKTEPWTHTIGFTGYYGAHMKTNSWGYYGRQRGTGLKDAVTELHINPNKGLQDALRTVSGLPMGPTDCALPMVYATEKKLDVDAFVIVTDNDTWVGDVHPHEALNTYRRTMKKPDAKLIVLATQATPFTIADPKDPGMLDIAGFDSAVPGLINSFITT